jgi:hypothetical protein
MPLFLSCYVVIPAQRESAGGHLIFGTIEQPTVDKSPDMSKNTNPTALILEPEW